jgi:hypothetical protein
LDISQNGLLEKDEVAAFMQQAAREIKLFVPNIVIMDAVDALMEDVGSLGINHITKQQFDEIFEKNPSLLRCFDDEDTVSDIKRSASRRLTSKEVDLKQREDEEVWESMPQMQCKLENVRFLWGLLYFAAKVAAFTTKGVIYANSPL